MGTGRLGSLERPLEGELGGLLDAGSSDFDGVLHVRTGRLVRMLDPRTGGFGGRRHRLDGVLEGGARRPSGLDESAGGATEASGPGLGPALLRPTIEHETHEGPDGGRLPRPLQSFLGDDLCGLVLSEGLDRTGSRPGGTGDEGDFHELSHGREPTHAPFVTNRPSARKVRRVSDLQAFAPLVTGFFDDQSWPLADVEPDELWETAFEGEHGVWPCRVHCYAADRRLVFISAFAGLVPEDRLGAMGEFCNRANFGLAVGNFELDYDGGEVRFRTSLDAAESSADIELIRNVVVANVITFDQYLPGIEAVLEGTDPARAIALVENDVEAVVQPD